MHKRARPSVVIIGCQQQVWSIRRVEILAITHIVMMVRGMAMRFGGLGAAIKFSHDELAVSERFGSDETTVCDAMDHRDQAFTRFVDSDFPA